MKYIVLTLILLGILVGCTTQGEQTFMSYNTESGNTPVQNNVQDNVQNTAQDVVTKGSTVSLEYTGTFDDGTVFDSSQAHGQPLTLGAGTGQVIPGFDNALIGMKVGEEKDIHIEPAEGYGEPNPQLIQDVPRERLGNETLTVGMQIGVQFNTGQTAPATITAVNEENVTLDFNHPLAGKPLNFHIKVLSIGAGSAPVPPVIPDVATE